jgi:TPR repeat protein
MAELPTNMQEGIAHLELEAREVPKDRMDSLSSASSGHDQYRDPVSPMQPPSPQNQHSQASGLTSYTATYDYTNAAILKRVDSETEGLVGQVGSAKPPEKSLPSPFPKLRDAGSNVPPSNEEQGAILDRAGRVVLQSQDAELQLAWAQDVLLWVDNAIQNRARVSGEQAGMPRLECDLRTDAINIVVYLANQSHPKALFIRGLWYEFGKFDYPQDRKEAFHEYRKAAERGFGRAEYRIGTQYEAMKDLAKAIKHYTVGVSMGDSASNYRLGMMALLGQHGQPQDYQLGIKRIRFAAETADENAPQGAYVYGLMLANELPNITIPDAVLPINLDQARYFVEKSAFLGFAKAQLKMGSAYELCLLGCEFNPALSLHYNALAAHQGEADADMAISKWFLCGFEGIFDKNEELAFTYAKRAAAADLPTAEFALGYFYEIGMYVPSDLQQAQIWYKKAADHGNRDALGRLESISQQRMLSKKDHEQIAITRIRSQYGSRRGQRPERLREKPAPMSPMAEERVDMPDPDSRHSKSGSVNAFMLVTEDVSSPIRPKSTAPYPEEPLRPKSTAPYPEEPLRPKSTAPYPEDDVAPSKYGSRPSSAYLNPQLRPLQGPPADRPSSAFGIRPSNFQQYDRNGQVREQGASIRPASSMGNMSGPVSEGRGSNPARKNRVMSAGWEPQSSLPGYRQPPPNQGAIAADNRSRHQSYDSGRNRLQKANPNANKPQPAPPQNFQPDPGYPVTPIVPNARLSSLPPPGSQTRHDSPGRLGSMPSYDARASLPSNNNGQRPARFDSMPQNAGRNSTSPHLPASPGPPRTSSATPSPSLPPRTSSPAPPDSSMTSLSQSQSQPSKPIKQGPQTFDEMGIAARKDDGECVSPVFLRLNFRSSSDTLIDCDVIDCRCR